MVLTILLYGSELWVLRNCEKSKLGGGFNNRFEGFVTGDRIKK